MGTTNIEWVSQYLKDGTIIRGFTFNPWVGCTKLSAGCHHCYAETLMDKRYGRVKWGPQGKRVKTSAANWRKPLAWDKQAKAAGLRYRVFCASLADVFEAKPNQPELDEWRSDLWALIEVTPNLDWLLLTKRPENVLRIVPEHWQARLPANIWIGTSVENQETADERIPHLLKIPAVVRFVSAEPLLGPIYLDSYLTVQSYSVEIPTPSRVLDLLRLSSPLRATRLRGRLDWVIVGGESGPKARPMHPDWARSLRDQCVKAGVPFFFKQWGEWIVSTHMNGQPDPGYYAWPWAQREAGGSLGGDTTMMVRAGKKAAGRKLDGQEWNEFPTTIKEQTNGRL